MNSRAHVACSCLSFNLWLEVMTGVKVRIRINGRKTGAMTRVWRSRKKSLSRCRVLMEKEKLRVDAMCQCTQISKRVNVMTERQRDRDRKGETGR